MGFGRLGFWKHGDKALHPVLPAKRSNSIPISLEFKILPRNCVVRLHTGLGAVVKNLFTSSQFSRQKGAALSRPPPGTPQVIEQPGNSPPALLQFGNLCITELKV